MTKIYYLSTCSTCQRMMKDWPLKGDEVLQDIKTEQIEAAQLEHMKEMAGSYEELFSRRARNYRLRGLNQKNLSEQEMRDLILEDYTFLKRPVVIIDDKIFIGNSSKVSDAVRETLMQA